MHFLVISVKEFFHEIKHDRLMASCMYFMWCEQEEVDWLDPSLHALGLHDVMLFTTVDLLSWLLRYWVEVWGLALLVTRQVAIHWVLGLIPTCGWVTWAYVGSCSYHPSLLCILRTVDLPNLPMFYSIPLLCLANNYIPCNTTLWTTNKHTFSNITSLPQ